MTSDPFELAKKVTKKREWAGFKATLRFTDPATGTAINTEVRYGKMDIDPAFSAEGVEKLGPHGGKIRYQRGEWKTLEQQPDGTEVEISEDDIKYYQKCRRWQQSRSHSIRRHKGLGDKRAALDRRMHARK